MTERQTVKLVCYAGEIEAAVGDKFRDDDGEWEIVSFPPGGVYSPSALGGARIVRCKPLSAVPAWWKIYMLEDGTCDWCGDSVALMLKLHRAIN